MILGGRSLYDLSIDDFISLINKRVPEGPNIEYKETAYSGRSQDIREMLRDISALANSEGGYLIMGIKEDNRSRAIELTPITNPQEKKQAIHQACLDCIQDRIQGLEIQAFETGENQGLIVVHVPSSEYRPHMMIRDHSTDLFKRYGTDKRPMLISEIREQILSNPRFQRLIELDLITRGYTLSKGTRPRTIEPPYIQIYTEAAVEQFIRRYLITPVRAQNLLIISPFIGDLSGERYSLKEIMEKASADKTRVYIVTRKPTEQYQIDAMDVLKVYPLVEIRQNPDVHAKLYVCWGREEEESFALFGSGNLTSRGLRYNLELGMMILARGHGKVLISDLYQWGSYSVRSISEKIKAITA